MKKKLIILFSAFVIVFFGWILIRYQYPTILPWIFQRNITSQEPECKDLKQCSQDILTILSHQQFEELGKRIDQEGLQFLPYPFITPTDQIQNFTKEDLKHFGRNTAEEPKIWGTWDGSWEPITLTTKEYFEQFIGDVDYKNAPEVFENEEVKTRWNTTVNLQEVFSWAQIIEYHFTGFNEEYQGLDRKSLYLVFVPWKTQNLKLKALAHGAWTI